MLYIYPQIEPENCSFLIAHLRGIKNESLDTRIEKLLKKTKEASFEKIHNNNSFFNQYV